MKSAGKGPSFLSFNTVALLAVASVLVVHLPLVVGLRSGLTSYLSWGLGFVLTLVCVVVALLAQARTTQKLAELSQGNKQKVQRIDNMETVAEQVLDVAGGIQMASKEVLAIIRNQEEGATSQSSAVEETRRTMESLLKSGRQITEAAQGVLGNAETTQKNNQLIAERISRLSVQTQRITDLLEVIKDIANKSELLALNAALEGTKAGEAGQGFSLVATQMQRLAENVMGSVSDIKALTMDIREATNASVLATEEGTKLAADTTLSAQQISLIIQQQQTGTEQVSGAMDDIAHVAHITADGGKQAITAIEALLMLSRKFEDLIEDLKEQQHSTGA